MIAIGGSQVIKRELTDDEILARAMRTPMSNRVPLKKGDQVIAMEDFKWLGITIHKGTRGEVMATDHSIIPYQIIWDSIGGPWWFFHSDAIGKLVPREGR